MCAKVPDGYIYVAVEVQGNLQISAKKNTSFSFIKTSKNINIEAIASYLIFNHFYIVLFSIPRQGIGRKYSTEGRTSIQTFAVTFATMDGNGGGVFEKTFPPLASLIMLKKKSRKHFGV